MGDITEISGRSQAALLRSLSIFCREACWSVASGVSAMPTVISVSR